MRSKDHTHHWKNYPPCKLMPSRWIDLPMTAICPLPENKMEAYFTFLEKKADFDLRVTVGDKQIRFFQRNRSAYTTFYLICIWTLQGSLVDLSIYIFEFVRCSEKKWEVGETCAASRGIFIFQFSSLFHTCYCNAPAIFKYSVPKQQTTTATILSGISGNESN